jgi:signal transduction histidine kinase
VTGIPMIAVGWLGWRFIEQDRLFDAQRLEERLENAANLLSRELERGLSDWESRLDSALAGGAADAPAGGVLLTFDQRGVLHRAGVPLPYYPAAGIHSDAPGNAFEAAEAAEYREEDLGRAETLYRQLAASADPQIRAGALMRLARALRRQGRLDEALDALSTLASTPVAGSPAALIALREQIVLFAATGQREARDRAAASLSESLLQGRYLIDRATFDFYSQSALSPDAAEGAEFALASAVSRSWLRWQDELSGRIACNVNGEPFAASWRHSDDGGAAIFGSLHVLAEPLNTMLEDLEVRVALEDPDGQTSWGEVSPETTHIARAPRETGLPWTLRVAADPATSAAQFATRRSLLVAGLVLMLLAAGGASYATYRALRRELNVARVQSDFVAAVSHEFRTPLTAMRHLTDLLEQGRAQPGRLAHYYQAIGKETRRLQAMVESLLDFARMESGRRTYDLKIVDAREFVGNVVDEFCEQASPHAAAIRLETPSKSDDPGIRIRADRDALTVALRNIIDNAVKYSPERSTVFVSLERGKESAEIHVEDSGPGIPRSQQTEVFKKFSRGAVSKDAGVKGTGIGLTIAQQIVEAHGGRLELESEPGRGSRFTIRLPMESGRR